MQIESIINGLSIEQKIGQLFMGNICGGESLEAARQKLQRFHFGGLQFSGVFQRFVRGGNYLPCGVCENKPLQDVARLLADIKKAAVEITGLPVIIGGDQEGGVGNSILRRRNMTLTPCQMGLGAGGSPEDTYEAACITADESKAVGLDMLYGPSLDVNTNPLNPEIGIRSFSEDPEVVAVHGEQVIRAYAERDVISTAKHFPGRGHGCSNAHAELEVIDLDRDRLWSVELLPFRRAIAAGADSVMLAHTVFPALESGGLPASLSPAVIGFLRQELGFEGVVIPDTLTMFAISKNFEVPRACAMCLEAGADMIFMKVEELYQPVIDAIMASLQEGRLTEEQLDTSLRRVLALKEKRGLLERAASPLAALDASVGTEAHVRTITRISRRCVLPLKNADGLLPLRAGSAGQVLTVVPRDPSVVLANDLALSHSLLPRSLGRYGQTVDMVLVDGSPTEIQTVETLGRARNADVIVFGIYSAGLSAEYADLLDELAGLGKPIVAVITCSPYVAAQLPEEVRSIICTFGITQQTFDAAADIIYGQLTPTASLPVTVPGRWPRGFALQA